MMMASSIAAPAAGLRKARTLRRSKASAPRKVMSTSAMQCAEYIWQDGMEGKKGIFFNGLRSKCKVLANEVAVGDVASLPQWSFDGSSTEQAEGSFSDCLLQPVYSCPDPIRGGNAILVMCEVLNSDGTPHMTNTRNELAKTHELTKDQEALFGIEQEYTMFDNRGRPFGWPEGGAQMPAPQGPFYCGVGLESVYGRPLVEAHMEACIEAGMKISGINAEVMPGQWEYQIGPAGSTEVGDMINISRWLLFRLGEDYGATCTLDPKPMTGDWNGAGCHTNYSTKAMRAEGGIKVIEEACEKLSKKHKEHISAYGLGNERRLTGKHETASIDMFKYGVADRGASIRIPLGVSLEGKGYLEDRRPSSNVDPYVVVNMLLKTTCL